MGSYEHNEQTHYFLEVQPRVNSCWQGVNADFRAVWNKFYNCWFDRNYWKGFNPKAVGEHNLWSKLVFGAAKELGFDLKTLSRDNWLPGVVTLEDFLKVADYGKEGLTPEDLMTRIF
jgi:hypothetical protein